MESTLKPIVIQKLEAIEEAIQVILQRSQEFATIHDMLSSTHGIMVFDSCTLVHNEVGQFVHIVVKGIHSDSFNQCPNLFIGKINNSPPKSPIHWLQFSVCRRRRIVTRIKLESIWNPVGIQSAISATATSRSFGLSFVSLLILHVLMFVM